MKCSSCGREIPDDAERCPGCGTPVGSEDALWDAVSEEYRSSGDKVDDFIKQIDIDYGDETVPIQSRSGASRGRVSDPHLTGGMLFGVPRIYVAAGAAALVALIIGMVLIFRSCPASMPVSEEVTESPADENVDDAEPFSIGADKLELEQGDTYRFSVNDSTAGNEGEFIQPVWSSSDNTVASVDGYGVVTAVSEGVAVITVIVGEQSVSCEVTVSGTEYSEWMSELPPDISSDDYDIQSARFYRFREKELTTSTESELDGWTVYESLDVAGEFGGWSDWQTTPVSANQTREVETRTEYSSRIMTSPEQWGEWSDWGYWSSTRQTAKNGELDEDTRTTYRYYYYVCPRCGTRSPIHMCAQINCSGEMTEDDLVEAWSETSYDDAPRYEWDGGMKYNGDATYYRTVIDQSTYYFEDTDDGSNVRTEYRYRTRSYTPEQWSDWGEWSPEEVQASETCEVRTRTVYRSRIMNTQSLNYFWRWGEWSEPVQYVEGEESFVSGEDIEFQDVTLYRYREK